MNGKDISNLRIHYEKSELSEVNAPASPFDLFHTWFAEALEGGIREPNAMVLSTVQHHRPHARVVLLKGATAEGFEFYTNYNSSKGIQLAGNPYAALTFFYDFMERQIRVEGMVHKLTAGQSDQYFHSRPRGSQIGAWVSHQSQPIASQQVLEEQQKFYEEKFRDLPVIPRPEHWGGYILEPGSIEFWQGRPNRLHDRLLYVREGNAWGISRLSP